MFKTKTIRAIEQLRWLYDEARAKDHFKHESYYRWVLSSDIVHEIQDELAFYNDDSIPCLLFGIAVDIDCISANRMELWKNITDDI